MKIRVMSNGECYWIERRWMLLFWRKWDEERRDGWWDGTSWSVALREEDILKKYSEWLRKEQQNMQRDRTRIVVRRLDA